MIITVTNSIDCHVMVKTLNGHCVDFNTSQLEQVLGSLTNNSAVINRAGVLILTQLKSYKIIKIYDLKCIIYRTLKQLSYEKLAQQYYQQQLA